MNSSLEDISSLVRGQDLDSATRCLGLGQSPAPGRVSVNWGKCQPWHCSKNQDQVYYVLITRSHYYPNKYKVQVPPPKTPDQQNTSKKRSEVNNPPSYNTLRISYWGAHSACKNYTRSSLNMLQYLDDADKIKTSNQASMTAVHCGWADLWWVTQPY